MTTVRCPNCAAKVEWNASSPWRPFCSERCRLIDLGEWLDEEKRIPGTPDWESMARPSGEEL
ncbi:MAG: DNA gyrase inhibitor YacG [Gammaproteobacteria bacterium]|nr:DNA gyrase inhibitor YacG [Gammaproteobacteria bacterium]